MLSPQRFAEGTLKSAPPRTFLVITYLLSLALSSNFVVFSVTLPRGIISAVSARFVIESATRTLCDGCNDGGKPKLRGVALCRGVRGCL